MKLCVVTSEYPHGSRYHGGIGTTMRDLARGFTAHGHEVHVVTRADRNEPESTWDDDGVDVHTVHPMLIRLRGFWRIEHLAPVAISRLRYSIAVSRKLRALARQKKFDSVISAEWGAETFWFALLHKKAPLLVSISGPTFIMGRYAGTLRGLDGVLTEWM